MASSLTVSDPSFGHNIQQNRVEIYKDIRMFLFLKKKIQTYTTFLAHLGEPMQS
jgi:hypothetical protein